MAVNVNGTVYETVPPIDSSQYKDKQKKTAPDFSFGDFQSDKTSGHQQNSEAAEQDIFSNVYIPSWGNKPEEKKPILSLGGVSLLTYQNTSSIIAAPGLGKSSLCEAICASFLNPKADTLGFSVSEDCKGVLYIDNERTSTDVWNSFNRMCRRAAIPYGREITNVKIAGLRAIPRLNERLTVIEQLIQEGEYSLLLIDGAGDLVTDSNDLLQAIDCRIWLREMTVKYDLSILTTLHPNPNSNKPRGHIGSEVHRESECVLLARSIEGDTRILTSDFEQGKNRNNTKITAAYRWSDEQSMFITADLENLGSIQQSNREGAARNKAELLALKVLPAPTALNYTELCETIMEVLECSEPTAKRKIKDMTTFTFIKKHNDNNYRLIV